MILNGHLSDIENFDSLSREHWAEFNDREPEFNKEFLGNTQVVICKEEGKTVGYLFYLIFKYPYYNELCCMVDMFFLQKDYRKQGIGKQMFQQMEYNAKKAGCSRVMASYNNKLDLSKFYSTLGYKPTHVAVSKEI